MSDSVGNILAWDQVAATIAAERRKGRTIVTTNGGFDVLHIGHIRYLQEAKKQGDVLVVGLNSDSSVKSNKGPDRPINDQASRAEFLCALRLVDYVVIFEEPVPMRFIELVKPDVHVNGAEYGLNCVEAPTVSRLGARLHLVPRDERYSSTEFIARLGRANR